MQVTRQPETVIEKIQKQPQGGLRPQDKRLSIASCSRKKAAKIGHQ